MPPIALVMRFEYTAIPTEVRWTTPSEMYSGWPADAVYQSIKLALGYPETPFAITWLFPASQERATRLLTKNTFRCVPAIDINVSKSPVVNVPLFPRWMTTVPPRFPESDFALRAAIPPPTWRPTTASISIPWIVLAADNITESPIPVIPCATGGVCVGGVVVLGPSLLATVKLLVSYAEYPLSLWATARQV